MEEKRIEGMTEARVLGVRVAYDPEDMKTETGAKPVAVNGYDFEVYLKNGGTKEKFTEALVKFITETYGIKPPTEILHEERIIGSDPHGGRLLGLSKDEMNMLLDYLVMATKKEVMIELKKILEDAKLFGTKPEGRA